MAAAQKWNVPEVECQAANSVITHKPSGRKLRYGEVAAAAGKMTPAAEPKIKGPEDYRLVGTRQPRLDLAIKSNGSAKFEIDTKEPGQLYASIASCPIFGGKLLSVDDSAIAGRRGIVKLVKLDDAVAVIADNYWRANQALNALKLTWDGGAAAHTDSEQFRSDYRAALDGRC